MQARAWIAGTSIALLLTCCGVKGPPKPLETKVPKSPGRLQADLEANGVRLSCKVPRSYADGMPLRDLEAIEFWRADIRTQDCPDCPTKSREIGEVPYRYPEGSRVPQGKVEYLDEEVVPGTYTYRAVARTRTGVQSRPTKPVKIYWDVPPEAVEGLQAVAGDGRVEIDWQPVTRRADGTPLENVAYQVFREAPERPAIPVAPELQQPHYSDTGVTNGRVYIYRVRALRRAGDRWIPGSISRTAEVMPRDLTAPPPPRGLMAFPTEEYVRLLWEGSEAPDIVGYHVYRAESRQGPWRRLTDAPLRSVLFEDTRTARGEVYWYAVTAADDATPPNESERSKPIRVSVP